MTAAWILAGVLGGALAGAVDAAWSIAQGIGGLSAAKALRLAGVDAGMLALAGMLFGALCAAGGWLARLLRDPARAAGALAAIVAAPILVADAFAMFSGHLAASLPGHQAVSVVLAAAGVGAVFLVARSYARRLARPAPGLLLTLGWAAVALVAEAANRLVLPRLYGWFHHTLAAVTLVAAVLAARPRLRAPPAWAAALLAAASIVATLESVAALDRSQVLRYAASERTALASLAMRAWHVHGAAPPAGTSVARSVALPPLPDGPRRPQADVLVITIDALRADHVGAYGYGRATTPNIDALARESVRFTRAYAQAPHTSFSISSMLTSKYFPTMARLAPGEKHETIAAALRQFGWKTAAFYPPAVFYIDSEKLKTFAETNFDFEYVKFEFIDAQRRVDQLLAYYDTVKPTRSFVWVHFFEPHEPYVPHPGFVFGGGDVDRYDGEIAYTDAAVGRLIREVRARRPGTIIIIAADHGEEFEEHGGRYHGSSLYEEQLRIPLLISIPGVAPHVVDGQAQLIDVTPTVLNLLDIPVPARMRGTDLGPWLATPPAPSARLPPAFAELEDRRMVSLNGEKLICDMRASLCAYYDLASDPRESKNLADERPARVASLRGLLDNWLDAHLTFEAGGAGGPEPHALERGRLGDASAAPELAALLGSPAPVAQRREAVRLVVELPPHPETRAALERAAVDPDPAIADWAIVGALRLGDGARRRRVQEIAVDPKSPAGLDVRAALALAVTGDASGLPILSGALDAHEDVLLCRAIIVALGGLHDERAVPVLLAHLSEVQNRREMVEALGRQGDRRAVPALIERLKADAYVPVRAAAAHALAAIGDRAALPALAEAAKHDTEPMVVQAAREAARALK
ncbi:MAG TPA: sulfatase-like hydrolase/transferase [Polyangia bacterium]|nr:sulfatase-like hydrolase/transferase [Polyangia bacterium]